MKIAILANTFPPEQTGGAAMIAARQAGILEQAGHNVRVWKPYISWFHEPAFSRLVRHLSDLLPRSAVVGEILGWNPDVLITHNLTGCGFGTAKAIQKRGVRWIHILHDVQLFEPSGRMADDRKNAWRTMWATLRKWNFGKPNVVLSPTKWLLDQHLRYGFFDGVKAEVLPNPAPEVSFVMRMPENPFTLFMVGNTREKGAEFAHGLLSKLENAALDVADKMPNHLVVERMKEVDALLVPSQIAENQPTVILEAASVGLPVIASDIGGVSETLNGAGILCPSNQEQPWIDAIMSLRDPAVYADAAAKMYELARQHDPRLYAERFLEFIQH